MSVTNIWAGTPVSAIGAIPISDLRGPAVQAIQLVFLEDWFWARDEIAALNWETTPREANQIAGVIPTGPADPGDSWKLLVAEAANTSRERLWIASPYFVPDDGVMTALQLAALRGVDVRIMLPNRADHISGLALRFRVLRAVDPLWCETVSLSSGLPPSESHAHRLTDGSSRHSESGQSFLPSELRNYRVRAGQKVCRASSRDACRRFQTVRLGET